MNEQRDRLAEGLYDAFWKAMQEHDDRFGYFDPGIGLIDGELPPDIFFKLADAAQDLLGLTS
jgi:hypothetical protein